MRREYNRLYSNRIQLNTGSLDNNMEQQSESVDIYMKEELLWGRATGLDTADSYKEYLVETPVGLHHKEAETAIFGFENPHIKKAYEELAQKPSRKKAEAFLEKYSDCAYLDNVYDIIDELQRRRTIIKKLFALFGIVVLCVLLGEIHDLWRKHEYKKRFNNGLNALAEERWGDALREFEAAEEVDDSGWGNWELTYHKNLAENKGRDPLFPELDPFLPDIMDKMKKDKAEFFKKQRSLYPTQTKQ